MNTTKPTAVVLASLTALGGLVLGAAIMLLTLEARDDGETEAEAQVEAFFSRLGGGEEPEIDFVLNKIPSGFPAFTIVGDATVIGGFGASATGDVTSTSSYAVYDTDLAPADAIETIVERAAAGGFTIP